MGLILEGSQPLLPDGGGLPPGGTATQLLRGDETWASRDSVVGAALGSMLTGEPAGTTIVADGAGGIDTRFVPTEAIALGTAYNAGTSTAAYLDVPGTPTAAPTLAAGTSLAVLFRPVSTPGGAQIIAHHDDGWATRGWHLYAGYEAGDRSHLSLYLAGLTGTGTAGTVALTAATFAGELNTPHVLAVAFLVDGTIRYSWDGDAVQTIAAPTGTYAPPQSGDPLVIGQRSGANGATSIQPIALRTYSTVLSDADLVAVAAERTSYRLAAPSAGTLTTDLAAAQFRGAATVIERASGQRWRLVGALLVHEQS